MNDIVDVLIVAGPDDQHATVVAQAIRALGGEPLRLNLSDLRTVPHRAGLGYFDLFLGTSWQRITSRTTVWWFRLGAITVSDLDPDEAQLVLDEGPHLLRGALSGVGVHWVDDPADIERAEVKLWQIATARALGATVPEMLQTNDPELARHLLAQGPVIAKAVSPGIGIAPFVDEVTSDDLARIAGNPTLLQRRIAATADVRVVTVAGASWAWRRPRGPETLDWRAEDPSGDAFVRVEAADLCHIAVRMAAALGLTMSVQDWLEVTGGPVFLEANPQGAWLFLPGSAELVAPALAQHLLHGLAGDGVWPTALRRFGSDLRTKAKAPADDGVVAPVFATPSWVDDVAARPNALDIAQRAREAAEMRAKTAEEKANRLVQSALALLAIGLALGSYQLKVALDHSWPWLALVAPVAAGLICLALSAFEAVEIDRVGFYRQPSGTDLVRIGARDPAALLLAAEEEGRQLAAWTARNKLSDLMQARAWFSRGLAALLVAGVIAGMSRAVVRETLPPGATRPTTSILSTTSSPSRATTTIASPRIPSTTRP